MATSEVINVALTDDHKVVTHALRSFLESFPDIAIVGIAGSGEELLQSLSGWPRPLVVVLDLLMPGGIDGIETARRIRETFPEVRIVALTASTDEARMKAVLRAGAAGYVRKDADPEVLLKAVRVVAVGRSFIDPSAAADALCDVPDSDLSRREVEVLREVALGHTNREIAARLFVSEETVKTHVSHALSKLNLENRAQLVRYAVKHGLIDVEEL